MRAMAITLCLGACALLGASCQCEKVIEGATDDMVKMIRAGGEISKQLGVQAQVGVAIEPAGKIVTVKLQRAPAEAMEQARPKIEAIVRRHLPDARQVRIDVSL